MAAAYQPTDSEKTLAIHHIAYELKCLRSSFGICNQGMPVFVAAFDSFLIHYRCLAHFLTHVPKAEDDVLAQHYVSGWKAPTMPMWTRWGAARGAPLNKLLQHLTYSRCQIHTAGTGLDHRRDFPEMLSEIEQAWESFFVAMPDHYREVFAKKLDAAPTVS